MQPIDRGSSAHLRVKTRLRYELKYLLRREQYQAVVEELTQHMVPDPNGDALGGYRIASVYFDTPDLRSFWDKLDGHRERRKIRVRSYGNQPIGPDTPVYLEVKHRVDQLMGKRRIQLPYAQAMDFDRLDQVYQAAGDPVERALLGEICWLYYTLQLHPTCVVTYHRRAFQGNEYYPDLRITFDTDLKGRTHDLSLLSTGHAQNHYFLPPDFCIMEVKINHNVPYWLAQLLSRHRCTFQRISKYCLALQQSRRIAGRRRMLIYPGSDGASP